MRALTELRDYTLRIAHGLERWFLGPADPRAYALLRIGYAVSALVVLFDLFPFRFTLLASTGLFGKTPSGAPLLPFNVFRFGNGETAVTFVLVCAGIASACLALGVFPRVAAIVTYLWATSYLAAATASQSGFDTIIRVVGFVIVILPTYGPYRLLGTASEEAPPAYGLRFVQWQVFLIYACTFWLKAPDPYWRNGEAVSYFLMSMFARFPHPTMSDIGPIGALFDYATLFIEATVPFFLWMRRTRFLGMFLGLCLHVGIAISSKIALFSLTMLALYPAFLEKRDFEALSRVRHWFSPIRLESSGASGDD